jgi:hypothetical protein
VGWCLRKLGLKCGEGRGCNTQGANIEVAAEPYSSCSSSASITVACVMFVSGDQLFNMSGALCEVGYHVSKVKKGCLHVAVLAEVNYLGLTLESLVDWREEALDTWEDNCNMLEFASDTVVSF